MPAIDSLRRSATPTPAAPPAPLEPLAQALPWLLRQHGVGDLVAPVMAELAAADALATRRALPMLQSLGLDVRLHSRPLAGIPADWLPAVLLLRNGDACVLTARDSGEHGEPMCSVVMPGIEPASVAGDGDDDALGASAASFRAPAREISAEYSGQVIVLHLREPQAADGRRRAAQPGHGTSPTPAPATAPAARHSTSAAAPAAASTPELPPLDALIDGDLPGADLVDFDRLAAASVPMREPAAPAAGPALADEDHVPLPRRPRPGRVLAVADDDEPGLAPQRLAPPPAGAVPQATPAADDASAPTLFTAPEPFSQWLRRWWQSRKPVLARRLRGAGLGLQRPFGAAWQAGQRQASALGSALGTALRAVTGRSARLAAAAGRAARPRPARSAGHTTAWQAALPVDAAVALSDGDRPAGMPQRLTVPAHDAGIAFSAAAAAVPAAAHADDTAAVVGDFAAASTDDFASVLASATGTSGAARALPASRFSHLARACAAASQTLGQAWPLLPTAGCLVVGVPVAWARLAPANLALTVLRSVPALLRAGFAADTDAAVQALRPARAPSTHPAEPAFAAAAVLSTPASAPPSARRRASRHGTGAMPAVRWPMVEEPLPAAPTPVAEHEVDLLLDDAGLDDGVSDESVDLQPDGADDDALSATPPRPHPRRLARLH